MQFTEAVRLSPKHNLVTDKKENGEETGPVWTVGRPRTNEEWFLSPDCSAWHRQAFYNAQGSSGQC